jgi:hypothetical protein
MGAIGRARLERCGLMRATRQAKDAATHSPPPVHQGQVKHNIRLQFTEVVKPAAEWRLFAMSINALSG